MIDKVYVLFFILGLSSLTCGTFLTAYLDLDWPHLEFNSPLWPCDHAHIAQHSPEGLHQKFTCS